MKTIWVGGNSVTIPNTFFCTKSRYAYVKVALTVANKAISLYIFIEGLEISSRIILTRNTDDRGVAIFPIGAVCESLVKEYGDGRAVALRCTAFGRQYNVYPIVGYADYEIKALDEEAADDSDATNYPAAKKIVVYPDADFDQTVFVPASTNIFLSAKFTEGETNLLVRSAGPFIQFERYNLRNREHSYSYLRASVDTQAGNKSLKMPIYVDYCTNGVFLKWIDKSGIPYVYRWTPEMTTDEMSVDSTYTQLDETLQPFEVQNKTLTKRYTLHSRIVERDIYEMCRTIIGSQAVWMWDTTLSDWVRCSMEDSEAEDSGAPMQDLVIEVVKREYNL